MGTPDYVAPELIAKGAPIISPSPPTFMCSGRCFYELLAGSRRSNPPPSPETLRRIRRRSAADTTLSGVRAGLRFSADGSNLFNGANWIAPQLLRYQPSEVWRRLYSPRPEEPDVNLSISALDVTPDGRLVAIAGNRGARILDANSGREYVYFPESEQENIKTVAFDSEGEAIFLGSLKTGLERRTLRREGKELIVGPSEVIDATPGFCIGGIQSNRQLIANLARKRSSEAAEAQRTQPSRD